MARCYSGRAGAFRGRYHMLGEVLGGVLSARVVEGQGRGQGERVVCEVILATNATVDTQTTAHDIIGRLADTGVEITRPTHGVPVGGELDDLDDGTLTTALKSRVPF